MRRNLRRQQVRRDGRGEPSTVSAGSRGPGSTDWSASAVSTPQASALHGGTCAQEGNRPADTELHDQVIRAIFAVGLQLQSTTEIAADPLVRRRIEKALSDLDDLVRLIRDTVFRLDHHLNDHGQNDHGQRPGNARLREYPVPDAAPTGPVAGEGG